MMRKLFGVMVCLIPVISFAKVYECNIGGKTAFQSKPCDNGTVADSKRLNSQSTQTVSDLSKINLETYTLNFSECKTRVLSMQLSATKQEFKTIVLNNNATNYSVKVCMPPNSSVVMTCDGMKRKMLLRRRAPCTD